MVESTDSAYPARDARGQYRPFRSSPKWLVGTRWHGCSRVHWQWPPSFAPLASVAPVQGQCGTFRLCTCPDAWHGQSPLIDAFTQVVLKLRNGTEKPHHQLPMCGLVSPPLCSVLRKPMRSKFGRGVCRHRAAYAAPSRLKGPPLRNGQCP